MNWIKTPEAYFVTAEELAKWDREVASPQDAQKFIDDYFRARGEQFRKDVHSKIEFADKTFGITKVPGSHTEMGRVWMILGSPNEQKINRGGTMLAPSAGTNPLAGRMQDSALEQGANVSTTWVYRNDRLPADLGISELRVNFITDVSRGKQTIDNPGNVTPYLRRAAASLSNKYATAMTTRDAQMSAPKPVTRPSEMTLDPLWNLTPSLNGALYVGDAFISPKNEPFYAVSFFLPKDTATFNEWKSGLLVSLVRNATGTQIVSDRKQVEFTSYDGSENRYVDRSVALPPGKYDAMFALYSPDGVTLLASHREAIEVAAPDVQRASKLLLSSRVDTLANQDPFDPFTFVAQKYAVRGDHRFSTADKISFFTIIANPTGPQPQLMQKMAFTRDGKPAGKTPLEPAQLMQTGPNTFLVGATFDAANFKPGHYTVELQVRDFNAPEGSELRTKGYVLTSEFDVVK